MEKTHWTCHLKLQKTIEPIQMSLGYAFLIMIFIPKYLHIHICINHLSHSKFIKLNFGYYINSVWVIIRSLGWVVWSFGYDMTFYLSCWTSKVLSFESCKEGCFLYWYFLITWLLVRLACMILGALLKLVFQLFLQGPSHQMPWMLC